MAGLPRSLYTAPSKVSSTVTKKRRWKKRPKPYNAPKPEDLDIILGKWKVRADMELVKRPRYLYVRIAS